MSKATDFLDSAIYFMGYGGKDAKYIFFGIDEKLTDHNWYLDDQKQSLFEGKAECFTLSYDFYKKHYYDKIPDKEVLDDNDANNPRRIYTFYRKILNDIYHLDFKENATIWKNGDVLLGNLYFPISFQRGDILTKEERDWTKIRRKDREKFVAKYLLKASETNGTYIFCFGYRERYKKLIDSYSNNKVKFKEEHFGIGDPKRRLYYSLEKIFLFSHPSYNWLSEAQLNEFCKMPPKSNGDFVGIY